MTKLRAGMYARVSDDEAGLSRSVGQQREASRTAVSRRSWRLAAEYSDPISASRFETKPRPGWERLLADLRAGRLDVVVLWESSRGDRKLAEWAGFLDTCRERGVGIYVVTHDRLYDLSVARDWRSLAEDGVDSAYESEKTSVRSRRGVADAAGRGEPYGRIPYGYRRTYSLAPGKRTAVQSPDPKTAPVVAEIIGRIAAGDAVSRIVTDLADRSVPSPTGRPRWARSSVNRLVTEGVVYIGKRRHKGSALLDGNWPPLVEADTYWRAVRVLADPARKTQAANRGGIRPGRAKWLCSYIAACAKCRAPLSVQRRTVAAGPVAYYRCSSSRGGCAQAPVEWVDWLVTAAVIRWASRPGVFEALTGGDDAEAVAARGEADAERERLAGFEERAIAGAISDASFARIAAGIEANIAELEQRAEMASAPPALRDLIASGANLDTSGLTLEQREAELLKRWKPMPVAVKRSIVATIARPTLAPAGRDAADPFRVAMNFLDA